MKKLALLIALFISTWAIAQQPTPSVTQPKGTATIKGILLDSVSNKPVEFANIALYVLATDKLIDGTIADENGKFAIEDVAAGEYKIMISFLGYESKFLNKIKIKDGQTFDVGKVKIASADKMLNEVTVTGQKSLIEEKVDRTVYNAEKDITARGGDAADVLRKVPLLEVDIEGNVSIRGSSNIRVLINNKPSTIMASSVADALRQIPADMIKTVEVITSPSARYDAEGTSGIVNIITKKNDLQGYFLDTDIGVGNRSSNLGLQGSMRQGKFGATIGGRGRAMYNRTETELNQTATTNGKTIVTKQTSDGRDNSLFGHYNIGMDYDIDKNQSLTAGVRFGVRNFARTQDQLTNLFDNNALFSSQSRFIDSKDHSNSVDVNLDYIRIYKPQQELSFSTQYSRNNLTNNFFSNNLGTNGDVLNRLKNINLNLNQEITLQLDYQTPLSNNQLLEFGGKGILRKVNSDFEYLSAAGAAADYVSDATRPNGALLYNQSIASAYTSYTISTKSKFNYKIGARYEYTLIDAEDRDKSAINIPNYGTLVPSINVSKNIREGLTVKAAYNRRIQRPGLQQLNPNFNIVNVQNISVGNPSLDPELTNNFELSTSTRFKQTFMNISLFTRFTNNAITQVRRPYDSVTGAVITTFENVGKQQAYGMNFYGNIYLTPKWTVNGGFDVYYSYLEGLVTGTNGISEKAKNDGFVMGGRLMTSIAFNGGWAMQASGHMRGQQVQLQGSFGGFYTYSLGVRKEFKNKKGSLGFSAENFLSNSAGLNRSNLVTPQFTQSSVNNVFNRGFKINLNYKIGKMNFEQKRKTRSVRNDDVKEGGDNGGGDGGSSEGGQGGGGRGQQGNRPQQGKTAPTDGKSQGQPQDLKKPDGTKKPDGAPQKQNAPKDKKDALEKN